MERLLKPWKKSVLHFGRDPRTIGYLAIAYYHIGNHLGYIQMLEELERRSGEKEKRTQYSLALLYAGVGEDGKAIYWLEQAYTEKEIELFWLKSEPIFQHLHSNMEFKNLLRRIGIIDIG